MSRVNGYIFWIVIQIAIFVDRDPDNPDKQGIRHGLEMNSNHLIYFQHLLDKAD